MAAYHHALTPTDAHYFTNNAKLGAIYRKGCEVTPLGASVYDIIVKYGPIDADEIQMRAGVASKLRFDAAMLRLKQHRLIEYCGAARDGSWRAK